jgi:hypothetical protein
MQETAPARSFLPADRPAQSFSNCSYLTLGPTPHLGSPTRAEVALDKNEIAYPILGTFVGMLGSK